MHRSKRTILTLLAMMALGIGQALAAPPVGVDGLIGAEWTGVTPTFVPFGPAAPDGQLVGFNVYVRKDADFLYVALWALPETNPGGWVAAFNLGLGSCVNLYLDTDPGTSPGSDFAFFPCGGFLFAHAYGDPDLNVEKDMDGQPTLIFTAGDDGSDGDGVNPATMVGGVREFAIAWSLLETDPDGIGFAKLTAMNPLVKM